MLSYFDPKSCYGAETTLFFTSTQLIIRSGSVGGSRCERVGGPSFQKELFTGIFWGSAGQSPHIDPSTSVTVPFLIFRFGKLHLKKIS